MCSCIGCIICKQTLALTSRGAPYFCSVSSVYRVAALGQVATLGGTYPLLYQKGKCVVRDDGGVSERAIGGRKLNEELHKGRH